MPEAGTSTEAAWFRGREEEEEREREREERAREEGESKKAKHILLQLDSDQLGLLCRARNGKSV